MAAIISHVLTPRDLKAGASFFVWFLDPALVGILISTLVLSVGKRLERDKPGSPSL